MKKDNGNLTNGSRLFDAIESKELAENIIDAVRDPLIVLDGCLKILVASKSFYNTFKVKPNEVIGQLIYNIGNKQWDIPKLRVLLEEIIPEDAAFDGYEIEHEFPIIGKRVMILNARRITRSQGKSSLILLAIEDITEPRMAGLLIRHHLSLLETFHKPHMDRKLLLDKLKKDTDDLLRRIREKTKNIIN